MFVLDTRCIVFSLKKQTEKLLGIITVRVGLGANTE